ncbi:MAG: ECF-type sigma factor [Pirellula sp.]
MSKTPEIQSIVQQLDEIKHHDEDAIAALWEQYYPALADFAGKRLTAMGVRQRAFNGEDVAASALASFFRAVQRNRFPALDSDDGLFRLLRRITIRKVIDRKRHSQTLKAGSGDVRGESAFGSHSSSGNALGIDAVQGESPSPEWIAMMEEECQGLFALLPDAELQSIACLRLEGYSNTEIAAKIGKSLATVERRLSEIRACWKSSIKHAKQDSLDD